MHAGTAHLTSPDQKRKRSLRSADIASTCTPPPSTIHPLGLLPGTRTKTPVSSIVWWQRRNPMALLLRKTAPGSGALGLHVARPYQASH